MMIKKLTLIILLLSGLQAAAQYPEANISNGLIKAHIYLPDAQDGFYRGMRFDWSGVISSLKYGEHEYFGQWYAQHNPKRHDAIQGPVEAFDPIGYEDAKPGETFLKIGIGTMKKASDRPYRFSTPFELVNGGDWKVRTKKDRIVFVHKLQDAEGYAYTYTKTLRLVRNKPELVLEHSLRNTGRKAIETHVFNHNFFMIDKQTTGPDFKVKLPFKINNQAAGKLLKFEDNKMVYLRSLGKGDSTMEYPTGFSGDSVSDYDFSIENTRTGAGVRITSDRPLAKFMYWSIPTTLSPEPFIKISASPGETFTWEIRYQFYETSTLNK